MDIYDISPAMFENEYNGVNGSPYQPVFVFEEHMITFQNLGTHGRLGNQLFQYAALRGIAEKNNYVCKVLTFHLLFGMVKNVYLKNFNLQADIMSPMDKFKSLGRTEDEKSELCRFFCNTSENDWCNLPCVLVIMCSSKQNWLIWRAINSIVFISILSKVSVIY